MGSPPADHGEPTSPVQPTVSASGTGAMEEDTQMSTPSPQSPETSNDTHNAVQSGSARRRAQRAGQKSPDAQITITAVCKDKDGSHEITLPDRATLGRLKHEACKAFNVSAKEYELIDFYNRVEVEGLDKDLKLALREKNIIDKQHVKLKKKETQDLATDQDEGNGPMLLFNGNTSDNDKNDDTFTGFNSGPIYQAVSSPQIKISSPLNNSYGKSSYHWSSWGNRNPGEDSFMETPNRAAGLAGLSNLGNTCFMNSSLQCLAHAVPVLRTFLSGKYMEDINRVNPLGMKGELAEAFGGLMKLLWKGEVAYVTPRRFKERIGEFAPQFSGYAQHDSQEFLAFLLDGLHEDLNRIKNKPYVEERDSEGRPEEVLAAEAWANYRKRNDSAIVDHFQGLYKSRLDCPKCHYTSVKFDPFMYLSLPLPESRIRNVQLTVVFLSGDKLPFRCVLDVPNAGCVRDVQSALWKLMNTQPSPRVSDSDADTDSNTVQAKRSASTQPLPPIPPMLCAKVSRGFNDNIEIFTQQTRVSEIVPSTRFSTSELLVMYVYPETRSPDALSQLNAAAEAYARRHPEEPAKSAYKPPSARGKNTTPKKKSEDAVLGGGDDEDMNIEDVGRPPKPEPESDGEDALMAVVKEEPSDPVEPESIELPESTEANESTPAITELPDPFAGLPHQEGLVPVVIHHRQVNTTFYNRRGDFLLPLILWLPSCMVPTTLKSPQLKPKSDSPGKNNWSNDVYTVQGLYGDLVRKAVHTVLKPFRNPAGIAAEEAAPASPPTPADDASTQTAEPAPAEDPAATSVPAAAPPSPNTSPITSPSKPAATLTHGLSRCSDPGLASRADAAMDTDAAGPATSAAGGSLANCHHHSSETALAAVGSAMDGPSGSSPFAGPTSRPFDMWAAQGQHQQQAQAMPTEVTGEGFEIVVCSASAQPRMYTTDAPYDEKHGEKSWHVLCEWDKEGGCRWDMTALQSPLPEHPSLIAHQSRQKAGKMPVSLQACVEAFLQPEELAEEDSWYCPRCKTHVQADKKLDLWALPEVLVVHLKRFSYTRYSRDKLDTPVDAPDILDLSPYISPTAAASGAQLKAMARSRRSSQDQLQTADTTQQPASDSNRATPAPEATATHSAAPAGHLAGGDRSSMAGAPPVAAAEATPSQPQSEMLYQQLPASVPEERVEGGQRYQLFAIVNHYGSLGGGHYTANAKDPATGRWYNFDDSGVSETNQIVTPAAYVLFYRATSAVDPPDFLPRLLSEMKANDAQIKRSSDQVTVLNHHDTRHDTSPVRGVSRGTPDRDDTVGEADWRKPVRVSTPARRSDDQEATVTDEDDVSTRRRSLEADDAMATSPPPHRASTSDSEFKQAMSGLKKSLVGNATGLRSLPWLQHGGERDVASTGKRNSTREWAFSGRSDQEEGGGQPWGDIDAGGHNTADTQMDTEYPEKARSLSFTGLGDFGDLTAHEVMPSCAIPYKGHADVDNLFERNSAASSIGATNEDKSERDPDDIESGGYEADPEYAPSHTERSGSWTSQQGLEEGGPVPPEAEDQLPVDTRKGLLGGSASSGKDSQNGSADAPMDTVPHTRNLGSTRSTHPMDCDTLIKGTPQPGSTHTAALHDHSAAEAGSMRVRLGSSPIKSLPTAAGHAALASVSAAAANGGGGGAAGPVQHGIGLWPRDADAVVGVVHSSGGAVSSGAAAKVAAVTAVLESPTANHNP